MNILSLSLLPWCYSYPVWLMFSHETPKEIVWFVVFIKWKRMGTGAVMLKKRQKHHSNITNIVQWQSIQSLLKPLDSFECGTYWNVKSCLTVHHSPSYHGKDQRERPVINNPFAFHRRKKGRENDRILMFGWTFKDLLQRKWVLIAWVLLIAELNSYKHEEMSTCTVE